jgi:hypothetical protein
VNGTSLHGKTSNPLALVVIGILAFVTGGVLIAVFPTSPLMGAVVVGTGLALGLGGLVRYSARRVETAGHDTLAAHETLRVFSRPRLSKTLSLQLIHLTDLHVMGALSDDEFELAKAATLHRVTVRR